MRSYLTAVLACVAALLLHNPSSAQVQGIEIVFPINGSSDVSVRPEVHIQTGAPIYPESITTQFPNAHIPGEPPLQPTVAMYELDEGLNPVKARPVRGTYELVDGTNIMFRPGTLKPNTTYRLTVSGLVVDVFGGQVLPPRSITFTTRPSVAKLSSCSLEGAQLINCSEVIHLEFTAPLEVTQSELMNVVQIGMRHNGEWSSANAVVVLNEERTAITVRPAVAWPLGSSLRLIVDRSAITGDPFDKHVFSTVVREASKVIVDVRETNGHQVPEDLRKQYEDQTHVQMALRPGDMSAIDRREDLYRFVRWESPLFGEHWSDTISLDMPCEDLRDSVRVTAVIERVDSIDVEIVHSVGGSVDLYSANQEFVERIVDTRMITFHRDSIDATIVAVPDSGYTFAGWTTPTSTNNPSPVLGVKHSIAIPVMNQPNSQGNRRVIPRFTPLHPTAEQYRLTASILDVDDSPGFNVNDGVTFTTESEFEENYQATKNVCVQAQPCWEIIGVLESSVGEYEFFDGKEEFCYSATLMDPENQLTFLVRRKEIQLRLERVVLMSDDPTDIALGKAPHPETYVRVEREETLDNGDTQWRYLGRPTCTREGITFSRYSVQCGDKLRFRAKGSDVRGQPWKYFAAIDGYTLPAPTGEYSGEHRYEVVIDHDIATAMARNCNDEPLDIPEVRMRACFQQEFGVEAIGLTVRTLENGDRGTSTFEQRWFDPLQYRVLANDEPFGGRQIEYIPRHGAEIKVRFTTPIDARTIMDGSLWAESYDNTLVHDLAATGLDFTVATSDIGNVSFEPTDGSPVTTVVFRINDPTTSPRLQALHGGSVDLTCGTATTSLTGLPLLVPLSFVIQSVELPGYGLQLRDITYEDDGDGDVLFFTNDGEMYHAVYGGDLGGDRAHVLEQGFERIPDCSEQQGTPPGECTLPHSDEDGPQSYGDRMLWMQPHWMDRTDLAWLRIASYDEDCKDEGDCLVNRVQDLIDDLAETAEEFTAHDREDPLSWPSIIPGLLTTSSQFIGALLPPDEQDEFLGEGTFLEGASRWWGLKSGSGTNVTLHHPNVTYRLLARPFVRRAVIR